MALALASSLGAADTPPAADSKDAELFKPVATVLTHPRCINCHTVTEYPRQGDDRHRHQFNVMRGPNDHGAAGAHCDSCHQTQNHAGSGVPGASNWRLAPLTMAWENQPGVPMTISPLCHRLLDKTRNGGRDLHKLEEHLDSEPLVRWAWNPGSDAKQQMRVTPPLSHEAFMQAFHAWTEAGAPCPN